MNIENPWKKKEIKPVANYSSNDKQMSYIQKKCALFAVVRSNDLFHFIWSTDPKK